MNITQLMAEHLTKIATDKGHVVELGWIAMRLHVIPADASDTQLSEMRKAFFLGAEHVWASIMTILDPGAEPTEKDMRRMDLINRELEAFRKEVTSFHTAPKRNQ